MKREYFRPSVQLVSITETLMAASGGFSSPNNEKGSGTQLTRQTSLDDEE